MEVINDKIKTVKLITKKMPEAITQSSKNPDVLIKEIGQKFSSFLKDTRYTKGRSIKNGPHYIYPAVSIETDTTIFASFFCRLWDKYLITLDGKSPSQQKIRQQFYDDNETAFVSLFDMFSIEKIEEGSENREMGGRKGQFWMRQNGLWILRDTSAISADIAWVVCRTLRNGFSHFNFSYNDFDPGSYFSDLEQGLLPPNELIDNKTSTEDISARIRPIPHNYRIFIADGKNGNDLDQRLKSEDARIIVTHFSHLRWSLYRFLREILKLTDLPSNLFSLTSESK